MSLKSSKSEILLFKLNEIKVLWGFQGKMNEFLNPNIKWYYCIIYFAESSDYIEGDNTCVILLTKVSTHVW